MANSQFWAACMSDVPPLDPTIFGHAPNSAAAEAVTAAVQPTAVAPQRTQPAEPDPLGLEADQPAEDEMRTAEATADTNHHHNHQNQNDDDHDHHHHDNQNLNIFNVTNHQQAMIAINITSDGSQPTNGIASWIGTLCRRVVSYLRRLHLHR